MLYRNWRLCNPAAAYGMRCPTCGGTRCLAPHGRYRRWALWWSATLRRVVALRVEIRRVRCRRCGATHALLPTDLVARSPMSVLACVMMVVWWRRSRHLPAEARRHFDCSMGAVRRAAGDAARLAAAIGVTLDELADALAGYSHGQARSLASSFAGEFGTPPFSTVTLPKWPPGAR